MKTCIIANGNFDSHVSGSPDTEDCIVCDYIIAADGGVHHCLNLGIRPDLIVGDMDSIDITVKDSIDGIEKVSYSRQKDKTDTEYAIEEALSRNSSQVTILGGTGGRIDHTMGNMALVAKYAGKVGLATEHGLLIGLCPLQVCKLSGPIGTTISVVPWGEGARVVTSGLKYPLADTEQISTGTRGISNEISNIPSSLFVTNGTILIFIGKPNRFYIKKSDRMISISYSKRDIDRKEQIYL